MGGEKAVGDSHRAGTWWRTGVCTMCVPEERRLRSTDRSRVLRKLPVSSLVAGQLSLQCRNTSYSTSVSIDSIEGKPGQM